MSIIPVGYAQVTHTFGGVNLPRGAAVVYGVQLLDSVGIEARTLDLHDNWSDNMKSTQHGGTSLLSTRVKYGPNSVGSDFTFTGSVAGTLTGDAAPPNVALLAEKRAILGGRENRGRMFVPGITESWTDVGGRLNTSVLGNFQTALTNFYNGLITINCPMVILHNSSSDPTEVTQLAADPVLATQRRRLR